MERRAVIGACPAPVRVNRVHRACAWSITAREDSAVTYDPCFFLCWCDEIGAPIMKHIRQRAGCHDSQNLISWPSRKDAQDAAPHFFGLLETFHPHEALHRPPQLVVLVYRSFL